MNSSSLIAKKGVSNNILERIDKLEAEVTMLRDQVERQISARAMLVALAENYTVTNGTLDRTYDADASSTAELADVLYTLLYDLENL